MSVQPSNRPKLTAYAIVGDGNKVIDYRSNKEDAIELARQMITQVLGPTGPMTVRHSSQYTQLTVVELKEV